MCSRCGRVHAFLRGHITEIRNEFMAISQAIGIPEVTAPKTLRHTFATTLQDTNVERKRGRWLQWGHG